MRKLVRGGSINEVKDKLKHLGGQWKPITEIKLDPSQISYNVVEYVCVVEMPDNEEQKAKATYEQAMRERKAFDEYLEEMDESKNG